MSLSKNFTIIRNTRAFSFFEITLVIVIVVILSSLAFTKFIYIIERAKTVEAVNILREVKNLQNQNMEMYGSYFGDGNIEDFSKLMFKAPDIQYFDHILVYVDPLKVCEIHRSDGSYHLQISDDGKVVCAVDNGSDSLCKKMGFK